MLSKDDKIREWNKVIKRYISLHKYIKEVGEKWILQGRSGSVDAEVQVKLGEALTQADRALSNLKEFFKPYLSNIHTTDLFVEDKLKTEIRNLTEENAKLKESNNLLHQLNEECLRFNQKSDNQGEPELQTLILEKQTLLQQVLQLEEHCDLLEQKVQTLSSTDNPSNGETHATIYRRKQQRFDETLKAQNDLIEDLKQQLADANKDREIFRTLNINLESVLQQRSQDLQNQSQYIDNNSNQRKLGHDEYELEENMEHLNLDQKHQKYLQNGHEAESEAKPNLQTIEELENNVSNFIKQQNTAYGYSDLQQQLQELRLQNDKLQSHHNEFNRPSQFQQKTETVEEQCLNLSTNGQQETNLQESQLH